ncbi:MAG: hypothetical protein APF76_18180 [Desulfitibacter sp. BRH_c19]|nr:MAG: hypothetical protein APF76_18180 [Desulfitibacter sp. BRH_c19]
MSSHKNYAKIKLKPCYPKITTCEKILLITSIPITFLGAQTDFLLQVLGTQITILGAIQFKKCFRLNDIRKHDIIATDIMDGISFEMWSEVLFRDLGEKVIRTKASGDLKADLIIEKKSKTVVQVKKLAHGKVGLKAVQESLEAKKNYKADTAMAITNQYFTATAQELARNNNVILLDRDNLTKFLEVARSRRFPNNLIKVLTPKSFKKFL